MNKRTSYPLFLVIIFCLLISCGGETLPKPKGMLRLSYPTPDYEKFQTDCSYTFEKNKISKFQKPKYNRKCWYNLEYPDLKATVYISYHKIHNNLDSLLRDAQNLTQEHFVKADAIKPKDFINTEDKIYGRIYTVSGNAASQSQFYVTDSTTHFLSGSVYFKVRPNYDSIQPAANYLHNDVLHLVETIKWGE
ncbi:gliding motility lipoprotein GldD [Aquimarina sp. RZ0]|uniref:gliding motility lipoprotein GldD n=1 Tax=Aquimarina sp. RZ0 TaxID=2607730 RepID=UPI0011F2C854|nr:gliding motility lipoprotein GldD [Aquimarina sp. RZ0]KAA1245245.1 gliding motility lipoprotein GldD [Aquimarina sp. RZ0]